MIVFLSALISGLQTSLIDRTLGSQAHVVVRPPDDMPRNLSSATPGVVDGVIVQRPPQRVRSINQWQQVAAEITRLPNVVAVAPSVSGPAMAVRGQGSSAVAVRGIEPVDYEKIVSLQEKMVDGSVDLTGFHALIGVELADKLGVRVGDRLRLQTGNDGGEYTISGIFDFGTRDLNERWVFVPLRAAQAMFALSGGVSTIEVRGTEIFDAEALAQRIAERTGLVADSWMSINSDLLTGLRSQSSSSYMIQAFVILAVALGIASVLAVSVVQKSREIGILRATGAARARVMRIFLLQGGLLGIAGSLVGILLGIVLALVFASLARNLDGTARFPVELTVPLFVRAAATAVIVGVLAGFFPARRAARMDPATAIRSG